MLTDNLLLKKQIMNMNINRLISKVLEEPLIPTRTYMSTSLVREGDEPLYIPLGRKIQAYRRLYINTETTNNIVPFYFDGIKFNMILCPPGKYIKISWNDKRNEIIEEEIKIENPFLLSETKVTQELYQAVMRYNPSYYNGSRAVTFPENSVIDFGVNLKRPVESLSWFDAVFFCNELSVSLGLDQISTTTLGGIEIKNRNEIASSRKALYYTTTFSTNAIGISLPTIEHLEYIFSNTLEHDLSDINNKAWLNTTGEELDNNHPTEAVAQKKPDSWGFYDLIGNGKDFCRTKSELKWGGTFIKGFGLDYKENVSDQLKKLAPDYPLETEKIDLLINKVPANSVPNSTTGFRIMIEYVRV
jgi:hypothetical protein